VTRRRLLAAGGILVALLLAGLVGRKTAPAKVETRETVKVVEKERTTTDQRAELAELRKVIEAQARRANVVTIREVVRAKDDTVTKRERIEDKSTTDSTSRSDTDTKQATETRTETIREVTRVEERIRTVTTETSPNWSASVLAGAAVPALWGREPVSYLPTVP
jgi:hypothetical protein